jgi:hypothetical protein
MRGILTLAPFDLVDLFFYLEGFEVVKFWLMGLELGVKFILACLLLLTN